MIRRLAAVLALTALAVAGCEGPAAPTAPEKDRSAEPAAFTHDLSADPSGYYIPLAEVRVDNWVLNHLFLGQSDAFAQWEAGPRSTTFGPVMIEFEDVSSPMMQTELGEARSGRSRVLPESYSVTDGRVRFQGTSTALGPVRFDGRLDQDALATARRNLGDEGAVLSGTLTVGTRTFNGVRLRWWAGD